MEYDEALVHMNETSVMNSGLIRQIIVLVASLICAPRAQMPSRSAADASCRPSDWYSR